jgi:hypothetical protein
MKRLLILFSILCVTGSLFSQNIQKIRRNSAALNHRERASMNEVIDHTNKDINSPFLKNLSVTTYIATTGNDETGDGTEANPYLTTEKAVKSLKDTVNTSRLVLKYAEGEYSIEDIIPYVKWLRDRSQCAIYLIGTAEVVDTINLTHPGGASQSYFRFSTDSTFTDSVKGEYFVSRMYQPLFGSYYAYPLADIDGSDVLLPGDQYVIGGQKPIVKMVTEFTVSANSTYLGLINMQFHNIYFNGGSYSLTFNNSESLVIRSCKFQSGGFRTFGISGDNNTLTACLFISSTAGEDALGANGNTELWNSIIWNSSGSNGYYGASCYWGRFNVEKCYWEGWSNAIRLYEETLLLSGQYFKDNSVAVRFHEPQLSFVGEASATYIAGHDSIISDNTTTFFTFNVTYDAGRVVMLPNIKTTGFANFSSNAAILNNTLDLKTLNWSAVDGGMTAILQEQISASLTDGAPTDAELDAATGTTPADAGAGYSVMILDSDGSALVYRVVSDGTNWQYEALTIAL